MKITYSINEYDFEGDIIEGGIYLHFENTKIKVANSIEEYKDFVNEFNMVTEEIYALDKWLLDCYNIKMVENYDTRIRQ